MVKKEKDIYYYNAINSIKNLDISIKKEEEILAGMKHTRTIFMQRVIQSENWIDDI